MTKTYYDRVKMSLATAPGTGTLTLATAVPGFQSFAGASVPDGATLSYVIEDGTNYEYGTGTYNASAGTLTRTTVLGSSSGGTTPITASASAIVYASFLAEDVAALVSSIAALHGVPAGGTTGQVLTKNSGTDYDAGWSTVSGGGGGGGGGTASAPTIVQQAVDSNYSNGTGGVTFGTAPTAGNLMVFVGIGPSDGFSANTGYVSLSNQDPDWQYVMCVREAGASEPAAQVPFTGDLRDICCCGYEIAGAMSQDATTNALFTAPAPAAGATSLSTTLSDIPAQSLVLAFYVAQSNTAVTLGGVTADTPFNGPVSGAGQYGAIQAGHEVLTSAGSATVTATAPSTRAAIFLFAARAPISFADTLVTLSDVDDTTPPTNGQVPTWNATESKFKFATPGGGANVTASLAATFDPTSGAPTITSQYNIASFTRLSAGVYQVVFTEAIDAFCVPIAGATFSSYPNQDDIIVAYGRNSSNATPDDPTMTTGITLHMRLPDNGMSIEYDAAYLRFMMFDPTA